MRIDKYLWCTRYYKTRNKATEACKKGLVRINGQVIKPSKEVHIGDRIGLRLRQLNFELLVLEIPRSRVGAKLVDQLRKDTTPEETYDQIELMRHARDHYRKKGTGRPTKKDRRDIEDYLYGSE